MAATNFPNGITSAGTTVPRLIIGEVALDGSNPTPVATGLTTITSVALTLKSTSAPGDSTAVLSYGVSGGTLNIYGWMNTSGTDPTLVASTGTETVGYIVAGT